MSTDGSTTTAPAESETVPALCCARCQQPLCFADDIIVERYGSEDPQWDIMTSACFSYDLDVLGREDCKVYSATNPGAVRFDVIRVHANNRQPTSDVRDGASVKQRVRISPEVSSEHSWFPPFSWHMCSCLTCGTHLGWAFENLHEINSSTTESSCRSSSGHGSGGGGSTLERNSDTSKARSASNENDSEEQFYDATADQSSREDEFVSSREEAQQLGTASAEQSSPDGGTNGRNSAIDDDENIQQLKAVEQLILGEVVVDGHAWRFGAAGDLCNVSTSSVRLMSARSVQDGTDEDDYKDNASAVTRVDEGADCAEEQFQDARSSHGDEVITSVSSSSSSSSSSWYDEARAKSACLAQALLQQNKRQRRGEQSNGSTSGEGSAESRLSDDNESSSGEGGSNEESSNTSGRYRGRDVQQLENRRQPGSRFDALFSHASGVRLDDGHLWRFAPLSTNCEGVAFFGLIVTKMRERRVHVEELAARWSVLHGVEHGLNVTQGFYESEIDGSDDEDRYDDVDATDVNGPAGTRSAARQNYGGSRGDGFSLRSLRSHVLNRIYGLLTMGSSSHLRSSSATTAAAAELFPESETHVPPGRLLGEILDNSSISDHATAEHGNT